MSFTAYGTHLGIRVSDPTILERLPSYLPPGWEPSSEPEVEGLYSLLIGSNGTHKGIRRYNLVYAGATRLVRTTDLDEALHILESHLQLVVAVNSTEKLFVHAGVVGWQGKAIVIPGRSFTGKTTLVKALLKAGATYYSDEYAIFDTQGRVWPYPRMLALRTEAGDWDRRYAPEELSSEVGVDPLPVGLILVTEYKPRARWQVRLLSPGQALLALLDNTVAARSQPQTALTTLQQVASRAKAIKSKRGEADEVVERVLSHGAVQVE